MESYLQGQDLWEIVCSNYVKPLIEDAALKKWNIKTGKLMFAIKSTIEEEMLQHKKKAKIPKEAWDTFAMIFLKKSNARLQLLENELLSISQGNMKINEYFSNIKSLYREISELDSTVAISEFRMKRIIVRGLRPEFRSFVTTVRCRPTQPTIKKYENLLANQEVIDKQMSGASVKNDKEMLFIDEKRHRFRQHSVRGSKGDVDKSRGHQQEGNSQTEGAERKHGNGAQYKPKKKFEENCYNCEKKGYMAKTCWYKKKSKGDNAATSN